MRFVRSQWKLGKSGRLIRVITRPKRPPIRIPTGRRLVGQDRERFEIIELLKKRRLQEEKEQKKKIRKELDKSHALAEQRQEKSRYKAYCSSCRNMKNIKEPDFKIIMVGRTQNTPLLTVRGTCVKCEKQSQNLFLRKATEEEIKAYGLK